MLISLSGAREKAKVARFKAAVHSMQTKALEVCDGEAIDFTDGSGSFGTIPSDIDAGGITENTPQNCGIGSANTFNVSIPSAQLSNVCTAVIEETGVTNFKLSDGVTDC